MQAANTQAVTKRPGYTSLVENLRKEIGTLDVGHMLAPERTLAKQYSTSHTTIRKVLGALEEEGLLQTYPGRGRVATDPLLKGEFAIVVRPLLMRTDSSPFYRETAALLSNKIHNHSNTDWFAKLHLGRDIETGEELRV